MNAIDPAKRSDEKAQSATPGIAVQNLAVRYGEVLAVHDVSFSVARGELVTLLGPSGCGKTTTLRSIAGLEQPHAGSIVLGGRTVYDGASRTLVPTEKRGVSMVFQSYAIWPHMTVAQNVAYGLRVRSLPRDAVAAAVDEALGLVQMRPYADRMATRLSGGQQQRIAVARAIAFHPDVVLFDEPLSNLDAKLREEMRVEIRELQQRLSITALYVTHDQEEALAISDRVIVMQGGRIEQEGPPEVLYNRPASRFVADFMGSANLIEGRLRDVRGCDALFETKDGAAIALRCGQPPRGKETTLGLRSAYIALSPGRPAEPRPNTLGGSIHRRMFHGDFIQYMVDCPAGRLVVRRPPTELLDEGMDVTLGFAPEHVLLL
jgi:ABC-type Fe3+/spermidine/putrescine transport system ATPase subunit